eukprot:1218300-Pleurochrysis_carterae.AAC.1
MMCDCIVRRMVKIQFLFERARSRAKVICCIHLAQILEEPWRTRWRRPSAGGLHESGAASNSLCIDA